VSGKSGGDRYNEQTTWTGGQSVMHSICDLVSVASCPPV